MKETEVLVSRFLRYLSGRDLETFLNYLPQPPKDLLFTVVPLFA